MVFWCPKITCFVETFVKFCKTFLQKSFAIFLIFSATLGIIFLSFLTWEWRKWMVCYFILHLFNYQFVRPPQTTILPFCIFFPLGLILIPVSCTMSWTSVHSSSGTLSDLVPQIYFSLPQYSHKGFDLVIPEWSSGFLHSSISVWIWQ